VPAQNGELTDRNNAAIVQINGVRDRLRVLLVSGEPHPGQRTWRNLLKADAAVDLVHFTILRPPDRPDTVPASELSLIAFPTRQLFLEVTDEFDLIIFDRYQRRGILPMSYIDNIARYVRDGGALLVAAGPDFAGAASLYRSSLAGVLPGQPTARVMDDLYLPRLSDIGTRHPVTAGLPQSDGPDGPVWGRWARQIDVTQRSGHTVMTGADGAPLLILDRVEQGRVALLASDHAWLWDRGFDGGGPQGELLRRLAHWMMGEPDLEEESLRADIDDGRLIVTRQTLSDDAGPVIMTAPDGTEITLPLSQVAPGQFTGQISPDQQGLYRVIDPASGLRRVAVFGPTAPREFENTIASDAMITPIADETGGGVFFLDQGLPDLRRVSVNQRVSGRGWMGVTPRGAYTTADIRVWLLVPVWVYLLLVAGLIGAAWMREGRRFKRAA
jgi:hypothetical protein